jgi:predicted site-specific integrase-resolvase
MKLSEYAKEQGVCYRTAYQWFKKGLIPNSKQISTGTILVNKEIKNQESKIVIYCRVSNHSRKDEMEFQVNRCIEYCNAKGYSIEKVFKEVASGMNDNRKEFWKMLNSNPSIIIVEHKDRLTRFGFNYIERLLEKLNCKIDVMNNDKEDEKDLIKDLVSIITSFCCRLYGLRRGYNKSKKIQEEINNDSL